MAIRRGRLAAALAVALCGLGLVVLSNAPASTATAKPKKKIVYPVKVTIKIKSVPELPPDSPWRGVEGVEDYPVVVLFGRVHSPKPACRRKRSIIGVRQPSWAKGPEKNKHTGIVTDSAGKWEGEPVPDFELTESVRTGKERLWAEVSRKRIRQGRLCRAAKSALLKA